MVTAPRRSASFASRPPCRVVRGHAELVVQVRQVLFHGSLGDNELFGDRAGGRGLGEHVAGEQRPAERGQDVALTSGERRGCVLCFSRRTPACGEVAKDQPCLSHSDLVAVAEALRGPDAPSVHPGAVGRAQVVDAPARGEALEHRVQMARGGVVGEGDVVRVRLADRHALTPKRDAPLSGTCHHLDLRSHRDKPMRSRGGLVELPGAG